MKNLTFERINAIIIINQEMRKQYVQDGIWELRPGKNRVFFFYFKNDTFVLLHHFRKTTKKTPRREIDRAKKERNDWVSRRSKNNE